MSIFSDKNRKKMYYGANPTRRSYSSQRKRTARAALGSGWLRNIQNKILLLKISAVAIVVLLLASSIFMLVLSRNLPDPNKLINREIAQSTKIYDRTGTTILYDIHGDTKRTIVNINDLPNYVKQATIAVEDKDFYKHSGFSFWAIFRTLVTNALFGKKAGASTLTQQLVKNAILTNEKTYTRKIKELILAYRIEKKFTKDEILQMYLNEIPYGSTAYGIEAASQQYFGKGAHELNLAEAAILAALPQAPSLYSPYGTKKATLIARQHYILDLMTEQGYITKEQAESAKKDTLTFKKNNDSIIAPHFVMYIKGLLEDKYGAKVVEQEGLKIYTTLDMYKQQAAEEAVKEISAKNDKLYNASNASLVSIDPKTGQILAMVGSRDYFDDSIDGQVNIAISPRQPGSSIKPIVYATAFMKGYTEDTVLYDVVTNFSNDPAKPYEPHNYNGKEYGPVLMKKALAGSLNIPAVKTLYLAGVDNVTKLMGDLGYTTDLNNDRLGLSLVLGGAEIKLLEHTNAYSAFAREGIVPEIASILKVEDKNGKVLEEFQEKEKKVFDPQIARMINDSISNNSNRAFVFGDKNYLTLPNRPVAAKTGTTNDFRDAWTIGYTPSLVTGVWVGNSDNKAMTKGADGSMVAAPIWNTYMKKVLGDTPVEAFKKPDPIVTGKPVLDGNLGGETIVQIDKSTGLLATSNTPESMIEDKVYKDVHCILYYVNKDDPRGPAPKNPAADPQFNLWESRVLAWAAKQKIATSTPPIGTDNIHIDDNKPNLSINAPTDNQTIEQPNLNISIQASAPRGVNHVEYYIDDNAIGVSYAAPFNLEKNIEFLDNGYHTLKVLACDDVNNCAAENVNFNLALKNTAIAASNIVISLLEPKNGTSTANKDPNLNFRAEVNNYHDIGRVTFSYINGAGAPKIFSATNLLGDNIVTATFNRILPPGIYTFYAEAFGWKGQKAQSEKVQIIMK